MMYIISIKDIKTTTSILYILKIIKNLRDRPEYIEELLSTIAMEHVFHIEIVDFQMYFVFR